MGKLDSILPIIGTVDKVTFVKTASGIIARKKGGISAEKITTDPAFERTRENNREFGRAGKAAKLIADSLRPAIYKAADPLMRSRLVKLLMAAIHADTTNARGDRNVEDGDLSLLKHFEFNKNAAFNTSMFAPYTAAITRGTGELEVVIPPYIPQESIRIPDGATHFRIVAAGSAVNFASGETLMSKQTSGYIPFNNVATTALTLTCALAPVANDRLFLALGIEYSQQVNTRQYPLNNGAFNAFSIIDLDV